MYSSLQDIQGLIAAVEEEPEARKEIIAKAIRKIQRKEQMEDPILLRIHWSINSSDRVRPCIHPRADSLRLKLLWKMGIKTISDSVNLLLKILQL